MDKKVIAAVVESIVANVAAKQGLSDIEARALVGIFLRKNADNIVNMITIPNFATQTETTQPTTNGINHRFSEVGVLAPVLPSN